MITKHPSIVPFLLLVVAVGCGRRGPETVHVAGTVTYQGKPLPLGSVMFVPEDRHMQSGGSVIDGQGQYQLNLTPGRYGVAIQMIARRRGQPAPDGEGARMNMPEVDWLIPENFANPQTSRITVTVEPGKDNNIDLPLQ